MAAPIEGGDPVHAGLLGVVQGLTEFLPVSSSGHLVLAQQFLDVAGDGLLFDIVVHVGTLLPVLWFYRDAVRSLVVDPVAGKGPWRRRPGVRLLGLLALATLPTAILGKGLGGVFEILFSTPLTLVFTFTLTGALLMATRAWEGGTLRVETMTARHALILGVAQGLAIAPGISRSGTTIAVALLLGFTREDAARFSFLMSVPAIGGAAVDMALGLDGAAVDPVGLGIGFVAAAVSGYAALVLLVGLVKRGGLPYFAFYCWFAALVALAVTLGQGGPSWRDGGALDDGGGARTEAVSTPSPGHAAPASEPVPEFP